MLKKVLKSVITQWMFSLSEEHSLLPAQNIGAHHGESIDTAIDYLVQLIYAT
jgi:hypothetical protein